MVTDPASPAEIIQKCDSQGVELAEVQQVRTGVYRGDLLTPELGDSADVYLKLYPKNKLDNLRSLVKIATQVGHPECLLIEDETPILVMAAASGRPLSHTLPVALLPGIWNLKRKQYRTVYREIGEQLGRLHAETQSESGPVLEADERDRGIRLTRYLDARLPDSVITGIQYLFERAGETMTEYVITYGDRAPHNIYVDGRTVLQIDCGCNLRTVSYEHVGLIMGIRLMCARLPYTFRPMVSTLEDAYWDGYTRVRPDYDSDHEAFTIRYLYRCLKLLELYDSNPESLNSKLTKRIDQPIILDQIKNMYGNAISEE